LTKLSLEKGTTTTTTRYPRDSSFLMPKVSAKFDQGHPLRGRHGTGSSGHLGHLSRPGHRVIILTRCETRVFPVFEKKVPKMQNIHLKCWYDKSHCQVSVVGRKSLDVSPCIELFLLPVIIKNSLAWEYFFTRKSTFGVHYRTGSTGSVGRWIPGSLGRWVTKCDPVPSLLRGRQMQVWWVKIGDFRQITGYISKTVQFLFKSNRKSYALYRMVALPMTLSAL